MGSIGPCCDCDCELCTEANALTNWSLTETIWDWTFSGTWGTEIDCRRLGDDCKRNDLIEAGDQTITSDWGDWNILYDCQGYWPECVECVDGEPILVPPCPTDLEGNEDCPPGHPNFTLIQWATRGGIRAKFWWAKFVRVEVQVYHVSATQVRFAVGIQFEANSIVTTSLHVIRKYREAYYRCGNGTFVSAGTEIAPTLSVPAPEEPCTNLLYLAIANAITCPDPIPPTEDPGCSSEVVVPFEYDCQSTVDCTLVSSETELVTEELSACCTAYCDVSTPQYLLRVYLSDTFDCDDIPASFECDSGFSATSFTVNWTCDPFTAPSAITLNIPATVTLNVS